MQPSSVKPLKYSLFNNCEVGTGKYLPFIDPSEALVVMKLCDNPHRENIITCKDKEIDLFLEEVNGLALDLNITSTIDKPPSYFPTLDKESCRKLKVSDSIEFIGLTLKDIIKTGFDTKAGTLQNVSSITLEEDILLPLKGKKVILFLTGEDVLIETIWHKRNSLNFFSILNQMGFYAISGFNFSLFGGECAFSHQLNLKRSLFSCKIIEEYGMKAIPHVYVLNDYHIERWVKWFNMNPTVRCFVMNCQLIKGHSEMSFLLKNLNKLLLLLDNNISVILQGFQSNYVSSLNPFLNRLHFTDKSPIKSANLKNLLKNEDENKKLLRTFKSNSTFQKIALSNILTRKSFLERKLKMVDSYTPLPSLPLPQLPFPPLS